MYYQYLLFHSLSVAESSSYWWLIATSRAFDWRLYAAKPIILNA